MGKDYIILRDNPMDMTRDTLQSKMAGQGWAVVMRSILMYEIERCDAVRAGGQTIEARTLRGLWYRLIKPSLERLGALEKTFYDETRVSNPKDLHRVPEWAGLMSKYLAELVRLGRTTYARLGIIDGSRPKRQPAGQTLPLENVSILGVHHPGILLFTEKDTIYTIVESIARIYGIGVLSGSGKPSFAATENLISDMVNHAGFATGSNIHILTLTDYDPSGYIIAEAVVQQVSEVAANFGPKVGDVVYSRLGLTPDQLPADERARNAYTPAASGLEKWFEETGGVDGQPLGLELDALPLSEIRRLFVDGLQTIITSEEPYRQDLAAALVDMLIWESLESEINERREALRLAIDADSIIGSLTCSPAAVARFAKAGHSYIDPLRQDKGLFRAAAAIRARLTAAME